MPRASGSRRQINTTMPESQLTQRVLPRLALSRRAKDWIKEQLCKPLHTPFNRFRIPAPLFANLDPSRELVLVDVGAFIGEFTATLAQRYRISRGVLIEALPRRVEQLKATFPPPTFEVFGCVVSNRPGPIEFESNEVEGTSSILPMLRDLPQLAGTQMTCPTLARIQYDATTLDDIASQAKLNHVDLIKIDVQGAEQLVLEGGTSLLARTSFIWSEVSFQPLYRDSCTLQSLQAWLRGQQFEMIALEPGMRSVHGELLQADVLFARRS